MAVEVFYEGLKEVIDNTWNFDTGTFYANLVVGAPGVQVPISAADYAAVLATSGLSEYTHASYVADKAVAALSVSGGTVSPTSSPMTITWSTLSANTAESNANVRALVICRQAGGSPATTDTPVFWIDTNVVGTNGDGSNYVLTWSGSFCAFTNTAALDNYYNVALEAIANGTFDWSGAANDIYLKLLVGAKSVVQDVTDATVNDVLATSGLSEYTGTNYSSNVVAPAYTTVAPTTPDPRARFAFATLPATLPYTNMYRNTAESNAPIRAVLFCYDSSGTKDPAVDIPLCWIDSNIAFSLNDSTPLYVTGGAANGYNKTLRLVWTAAFGGLKGPN